jgi:hypothetical protein
MIARLGNVLYWIGCAAAVLWLALSLYGVSSKHSVDAIYIIAVVGPALVFWLAGRALRYILSGT